MVSHVNFIWHESEKKWKDSIVKNKSKNHCKKWQTMLIRTESWISKENTFSHIEYLRDFKSFSSDYLPICESKCPFQKLSITKKREIFALFLVERFTIILGPITIKIIASTPVVWTYRMTVFWNIVKIFWLEKEYLNKNMFNIPVHIIEKYRNSSIFVPLLYKYILEQSENPNFKIKEVSASLKTWKAISLQTHCVDLNGFKNFSR